MSNLQYVPPIEFLVLKYIMMPKMQQSMTYKILQYNCRCVLYYIWQHWQHVSDCKYVHIDLIYIHIHDVAEMLEEKYQDWLQGTFSVDDKVVLILTWAVGNKGLLLWWNREFTFFCLIVGEISRNCFLLLAKKLIFS